ncbi:putative replication protein RepB [Mycoplasma phage MAV1]|uniref:Bacteriophage MAV1 replication protein RepB n=1 Tax=Metamycoplasma arthritidis (strain 158L3-1) TaxID=243272 RepID=B3PNA4_META1|nr:DnaB-like helicase C-terminal domain-containing protein [Metamycoplasma arthritidis]NP_047257.1 AAA family ATPase [Mycoplasma phage MAV1]AAC33767.1 putative replication protein RepB [Mycoplasma phage MAV1]ACF07506.1 bacteriophage MAV1 replication protein RepB [Metamycoplasma arthritidis 158L3-1]
MEAYWLNELIVKKDNFISGEENTIKTNIDILDKNLNGLISNQLYIFAGRPATGKTTFVLNLILKTIQSLKSNEVLVFFSLEMSIKEVLNRILKINSVLKIENLDLEERLLIVDDVEQNNDKIHSLILDLNKTKKVKAIFIDHLQLLDMSDSTNLIRYEKITRITRELKKLARKLNVNVFAISQLSREFEKRQVNNELAIPVLSDLRESGSIEQDADVVLFLSNQKVDYRFRNMSKCLISIAKNRNGKLASSSCLLNLEKSLFYFTNFNKGKNNEKE